jgi:hypothetical protein
MMADSDKPSQENPDRERLLRLKRELANDRADLVDALKRAAADVGKGGRDSKKSWVGENADRWHSDINGHRQTVRARIDKVLDDIQREIDRMPEKVTAEEANSMNKSRSLW